MKSYRFELHCHTDETSFCGKVPAAEIVRLYFEQGYDGIVITDHFNGYVEGNSSEVPWDTAVDRLLVGYRAAREAADRFGITVFLGMELRFPGDENDFLVYGVTEQFLREHPWIYESSLAEFHELANRHGLIVVQAHPFRGNCSRMPVEDLDGIEIINGHPFHNSHNDLAKEWADACPRLIQTVGSDFHEHPALAATATEFPRMPESIGDLVTMLKNREYRILYHGEYAD